MKKLISIVSLSVFLVALSVPAFCDNPPKAKVKTEADSCKSKKCDKEKCKGKCSESKDKGTNAAKCCNDKKAGCCKDKSTTQQAK